MGSQLPPGVHSRGLGDYATQTFSGHSAVSSQVLLMRLLQVEA